MMTGRSPFAPDRYHIHHRLLDLGLSHLQSSLLIIGLNLFIFTLAIILRHFGSIKVLMIILPLAVLISSMPSMIIRHRHKELIKQLGVFGEGAWMVPITFLNIIMNLKKHQKMGRAESLNPSIHPKGILAKKDMEPILDGMKLLDDMDIMERIDLESYPNSSSSPYHPINFSLRPGFLFVIFFLACLTGLTGLSVHGQSAFRVLPYLQNPAPDAITVIWFSEEGNPGVLSYGGMDTDENIVLNSEPVLAESLSYSLWEDTTFFGGLAPAPPFKHRIRLEGLDAASQYHYSVSQDGIQISSSFQTAPDGDASFRFIVYADSETEPESTGKYTQWVDSSGAYRSYLVDETTGYSNNLELIRSREPDLVFVAGDLVESGGEQRDWDEFWVHNGGDVNEPGIAGQIPLITAMGNHDYYEGPKLDQYNQPGSERAAGRYLSYFEGPSNGSPNPKQEGRYYSLKYGPAVFIVLDVCNNGPNGLLEDTNYMLLGESDSAGGNAPDFYPGSRQYEWLEQELDKAQEAALFTFVLFHHAPYSSGPHALPPGNEAGQDNQRGTPVRELTPLFLSKGVDAVFSGHDEMWERSEVDGIEIKPDGSQEPYTLHFYDVGIGGDGLRGPYEGTDNPNQVFLAHNDAPEIWEDSILVEGGRHYGHLEVNIEPISQWRWGATLDPVYVLPVKEPGDSLYSAFERHLYHDQVVLESFSPDSLKVSVDGNLFDREANAQGFTVINSYPNPFRESICLGLDLQEAGTLAYQIYDLQGRAFYSGQTGHLAAGYHEITWDGMDQDAKPAPPGFYVCRMDFGEGRVQNLQLIKL